MTVVPVLRIILIATHNELIGTSIKHQWCAHHKKRDNVRTYHYLFMPRHKRQSDKVTKSYYQTIGNTENRNILRWTSV